MYVGIPGETTHGDKDYATVAKDNSEIEDDIGLTLAKDSRLTALAADIKEKSGVVDYEDADQTIKDKMRKDFDDGLRIGGARAYQEDWGTLGGSVNAVMNQIEVPQGSKDKYSKSSTEEGHPYFPKGEKKPDFDKRMSQDEANASKIANPDAANTAKKLVGQVVSQYSHMTPLLEELQANSVNREIAILFTRSLMGITEDVKGMLGALLDISLDVHSSGNNANRVQRGQNPKNLNENEWIGDTVKAGKPIISGPSGHTLRYLNFWAEKRKLAKDGGTSISNWPSLEAARLVMMADLMPPKHHSYDEIMTSSIGIQLPESQPLKYFSKSTYDDMLLQCEPDADDIATNAYFKSEAYKVLGDDEFDRGMRAKKAITETTAGSDEEHKSK